MWQKFEQGEIGIQNHSKILILLMDVLYKAIFLDLEVFDALYQKSKFPALSVYTNLIY